MLIRIDLVFSYWIFAWYLAYMTKLTPYNPKWGLMLGIVENILQTIVLVLYNASLSSILLFLLINLAIKGIPLYTIYNTKSTTKDIYALALLFAIYIQWVHVNGETVIGYYQKIFDSILHNKNETPTMWLISKLRNYATRS
jgi:hypothetical protein